MRVPSVALDDDSLSSPEAVGPDPAACDRDRRIELGPFEPALVEEEEEAVLERALGAAEAGKPGGENEAEVGDAPAVRVAFEQALQWARIAMTSEVSFGKQALEGQGVELGGEIEDRPGDGGRWDAVASGSFVCSEGGGVEVDSRPGEADGPSGDVEGLEVSGFEQPMQSSGRVMAEDRGRSTR